MILASELIVIILTLLFIPPNNPFIIFLLIVLVSAFIYGLSRIRLTRKYSLLTSFFTGCLLGIFALGVFDIINIILLLSLFAGLSVLFK